MKLKTLLSTFLLIFLFGACNKTDTNMLGEMDNLIKDFQLKKIEASELPKGTSLKHFNTYADARAYLDQLKNDLSKTKRKKGKATIINSLYGDTFKSNQLNGTNNLFNSPIMSYCSPCSGGFANATTDYANFGTMHLAFNYSSSSNGYSINNLSTYTTGFTLLGWNQTGFTNYSSSSYISFCVQGTVTAGIEVGGVTLGYVTEHNYYISLNPCGGGYDITDGPGGC